MAILAFQKPDKVIMLEATDSFGRFEFRPLEPGYAVTVGNALRRVLLSSLEGYAITSVRIPGVEHEFDSIPGVMEEMIDIIIVSRFKLLLRVLLSSLEGYAITTVRIPGVEHEFDSIPGVMEEMIDIILNLKQVCFASLSEEIDSEKVTINVAGLTELTAGYMSNFLTAFKVLNPDLVLCRLQSDVKFQMEITIGKGRGYVPAEENMPADAQLGLLPIDSIHTPVKNVKYWRDDYRVEQKTNFDRLNLEITTDGSIHPKDALKEAAQILIHHLMLFSDKKIALDIEEKAVIEEFDEDVLHMRQLLKTKLTEQDLSVRALNCLKAAEVETIGELVRFQRNDLLKFRNFGKKSLSELDELLENLNLHFGMDVSKYKLDKD